MPTSSGSGPRSCPRDGGRLRPVVVDRLKLRVCDLCGGFALSRSCLEPLLERIREGIPVPIPGRRLRVPVESDGDVECGCAGRPRMHALSRGGVTIDFCRSCFAVWLDAGEALAIARVLAPASATPKPGWRRTIDVIDDGVGVVEIVGHLVGFVVELFS